MTSPLSDYWDDTIRQFHMKVKQNKNRLERRSVGIVDIKVGRRPRKLELWGVIIWSHKTDDYYQLPGKYSLTYLSNDGYEVILDVPDGGRVRVLVRCPGGWVTISTPGCGYSVFGQVGNQPLQ